MDLEQKLAAFKATTRQYIKARQKFDKISATVNAEQEKNWQHYEAQLSKAEKEKDTAKAAQICEIIVSKKIEIEKKHNLEMQLESKKRAFWKMVKAGVRFGTAFGTAFNNLNGEEEKTLEYYIKEEHRDMLWMREHQVAGLFLKMALMESEIPSEYLFKKTAG